MRIEGATGSLICLVEDTSSLLGRVAVRLLRHPLKNGGRDRVNYERYSQFNIRQP